MEQEPNASLVLQRIHFQLVWFTHVSLCHVYGLQLKRINPLSFLNSPLMIKDHTIHWNQVFVKPLPSLNPHQQCIYGIFDE